VIIGNGLADLANWTFYACTNLVGVYFRGNAPNAPPEGSNVFGATEPTVYYLPGTTDWGLTFGGRPTALWKPQTQNANASFGVQTNQFGFDIAWTSGQSVVVEACTNAANSVWTPLQTNTLTGDSVYFSDPQWTNYSSRFYRIRWP
jgi:hypothetical protein